MSIDLNLEYCFDSVIGFVHFILLRYDAGGGNRENRDREPLFHFRGKKIFIKIKYKHVKTSTIEY